MDYFQLVDMQWSLGMSMASSNCRNLNSPFVAVLLKVAEPSGTVTERSFEMTVPEFKVGFSYLYLRNLHVDQCSCACS